MKTLFPNVLNQKTDVFINMGFLYYTLYRHKLKSELVFKKKCNLTLVFKFTLSRLQSFAAYKNNHLLNGKHFLIKAKDNDELFHNLSYNPAKNSIIEDGIEYSLLEHLSLIENPLISSEHLNLICGNYNQYTNMTPLSFLKDHTLKDLLFSNFSEKAKNDVLSLVIRRELFFIQRRKNKRKPSPPWAQMKPSSNKEKERLEKLGYIMTPIEKPVKNLNDPNLILRAENAS